MPQSRTIVILGSLALLFAASVRPLAGQEATAGPEALTLEQALALALKNSASILSAEAQVQRSEEELGASRTRRLPTVEVQATGSQLLSQPSVSFPAGAFGTYPGTGPIPATDTLIKAKTAPTAWINATVAQPLTQLHKAGLGVKANQLTRDSERQQLRLQRAAVAHDVRRLYYGALQSQSAAEAARDQAKALRQMDSEVTRYVALEAALPQDGLEVKARVAAQEYQIVALDNAVESYKEQLNVLFGRDPRTPFALVGLASASLEEVNVEAARARALDRRPELERARLQVELADTQRRLKKAEFIPEISLAVSYNSFFNVDLLPRSIAQLGLQLKWEPFDWGRRRRELASKTLAVEQARFAARDERHRVLVEVDRAFRQVQEARALVAARRMGHESAQERARVALVRGRAQTVLLRDVLQAQAEMAQSRADYDAAQLSLWQARAELDKAMGEDM
jgi:outer membrane protein TolC